MQRSGKMLKKLFMVLVLLLACAGFGRQSVLADTITISVERFSLGGDFLIEPEEVEIQENEKYSDVIPRVLKATGKYEAVSDKKSSFGYYMSGINGALCEVHVPDCVQAILNSKGTVLGENKHTAVKGLYEFDYTKESGWMYTVNNEYVMGMSNVTAKDGDVVRVMYTLTMGAELFGKDSSGGNVYYTVADKSALMRLMAEANTDADRWKGAGDSFTSAYQTAKRVMAKMNASESDVKSAVALLQSVKNGLPETSVTGVTLKKTGTLVEGESAKLKYQLVPRYATAKNTVWTSSNPAVAGVDQDGTVTAVKAGTAKISLTVDGSYTAEITVEVKQPVKEIKLNKSELTMRADEAAEQLTCTLLPENSYAKIIWKSTDTDVVSVSQDGLVMANDEGSADVIAMSATDGSVQAVCHVSVLPSFKRAFRKAQPQVTLKATGSHTVQLSWKAVDHAETYLILRHAAGTSEWTQLARVSQTTYTDSSAQPSTTYYYAVQAASTRWGDEVYSEYATDKTVKTPADVRYIDVPKSAKLTYTGATQTGVAAGTGYTLSGTVRAAGVGTYTAKATLLSGYAWKNGSTAPVSLTWSIGKGVQTVSAKVASKTYTVKALKKKAASFTIGAGARGTISYRVSRTPAGGGKYITVDKNGKVTLKKKAPGGVYEITVTAAGTASLNQATRVIKVNVTKQKQTVSAKKKAVTYTTAKLKKNQTYSIGGKAKSKVTYRLTKAPANGNSYVKVSSKGKVTVKKGAPKGMYYITLLAAETKDYAAASRVVTVCVK